VFVALGLIAGIILNAVERSGNGAGVPWNDSVVLTSSLLLMWLIAATVFEWLYKPAQQGRKVAYLTVASFLFLALVITVLLAGGSQHAQPRSVSSRFQVSRFRFVHASPPTWNLQLETCNAADAFMEIHP
jgi:hypothetical protein